jgi:hypothetical protein
MHAYKVLWSYFPHHPFCLASSSFYSSLNGLHFILTVILFFKELDSIYERELATFVSLRLVLFHLMISNSIYFPENDIIPFFFMAE